MIRLALSLIALATPALADSHPDAHRIVSIGGAVTEIVAALGEEDRLVGRDTTSNHPPSVLDLPDVGYIRRLSPEGLLSVNPDLLLAEEGAGPPEAVDLLAAASVPMETIPSGFTRNAVEAKIMAVAQALGVEDKGRALADRTLAGIDAARASVTGPERKVLFILSLQGGRIMAAGADTSADGIIQMAGAKNALEGVTGYKLVSDEAIAQSGAEVILMMANAGGPGADEDELFAHPAIRTTPAAASRALVRLDGMLMLGFSVRTPQAIRDLSIALQAAES